MTLRVPSPFDSSAHDDGPPEILVALDGSSFAESALPLVAPLARALEGSLHLMAVLDPERSGGTSRTSAECRLQLLELENYLRRIREGLRRDGFEVTLEVREGAPAEEIARAAEERGSLLVALAARPRHRGARLESRGVAQRVIASGAGSLLVARGGSPAAAGGRDGPGFRLLAVAVDGSAASHRALRLAAALAGDGDTELVMIHVFPPGSDGGRRTAGRYLERLERALNEEPVEVRSVLCRASGVAGAVEEAASDAGAELLLLGARGAGRTPGTYGRCSRSLLIHCDVPVLVVGDRPRPGASSRQGSRRGIRRSARKPRRPDGLRRSSRRPGRARRGRPGRGRPADEESIHEDG